MATHYVYFFVPKVGEPDRVKIGITRNVVQRKRSIEQASGSTLVCIWALSCASKDFALKIEKLIHQTFKEYRLRGEWFEFVPHIWEFPSFMERIGLNGLDCEFVEVPARGDVSHLDHVISDVLSEREGARG